MADGEVTFVAGQAVEQTTSGESNTPTDEREAAIAAVRKAIKEAGEESAKQAADAEEKDEFRKAAKKGAEAVEGKKEPKEPKEKPKAEKESGPERDENGRFLPKEARNAGDEDEAPGVKDAKESKGKEKPTKEPEEHSLKKVLTERKELTELKKQRMDEAAKAAQELQALRHQIAMERQQLEADRQRIQKLKTDPAAAIREIGYNDPEEYILELARQGTPEGQAMRQAREARQQLAELQAWKRQQEEQVQSQREQFERQKAAKYREYVEQEFIKTAFNEEAYPHASTFFKKMHPMFAVAMGDVVAEQYRQLSGREATMEQIAEYLEDTIGEWYTSKSGAQQGPGKVASALSAGQSTQGSATGRTLNPNSSSERRSLGTPIANLDGEERLAAAKDAVRIALHASGERN